MFSVADKRVIITGGSRGIGASVARSLVHQGARVAIFDVLDSEGKHLASKLNAGKPGSITYFHVDVSSRKDVVESVESAVKTMGGLDSLLNIAGVERSSPIEDVPESALDFMINVNVKGSFFMAQAVFPHLKESGGSILNFGSGAGLEPMPNGSVYGLTKGAVHSLTRNLASEWGRYRIRVNSVLPAIKTPMYEQLRKELSAEQLREHDADLKRRLPLGGQLGDADKDLAPVMVFLVSNASQFITGQILPVDGGASSTR